MHIGTVPAGNLMCENNIDSDKIIDKKQLDLLFVV